MGLKAVQERELDPAFFDVLPLDLFSRSFALKRDSKFFLKREVLEVGSEIWFPLWPRKFTPHDGGLKSLAEV